MQTIMILGDSTSMTIGLEKRSYPFVLEGLKIWTEETEIINCSQPGFTACDAAAFFFSEVRNIRHPSAVVIYLGNCDANANEIRKGRYTPVRRFRHRLNDLLGIKASRRSLKNRLLRFEWNDTYDSSLEQEESTADYEYNLTSIIGYCAGLSIPVILIRPTANLLFPSGVGKGNFMFYKYLNMDERIAGRLSMPDSVFLDATRSFEAGRYEEAMSLYKKALLRPRSPEPVAGECDLIAVNNYAVCAAHAGRFEESEKLFKLLLQERMCRREIVMYNLAFLYRIKGENSSFAEWIERAYQVDASLYRVKEGYRRAIDLLARRFSRVVSIVNMEEFAQAKNMFIDHCHLIPEGQDILARRVIDALAGSGVAGGNKKARIRNILYNPELALGNKTEFYDYYRTYAPMEEKVVENELSMLKGIGSRPLDPEHIDRDLHFVSKEVRHAIALWMAHPCFTSLDDILRRAPFCRSDVGRFPEFFIYRVLIPYLKIFEIEKGLFDRFDGSMNILHTSEDFLRMLPSEVAGLVRKDEPLIDAGMDMKWLNTILDRVKGGLIIHLRGGNKIHERMKTTIFWYFRETLRWGSHSRISMRYDRLFLEFSAEALAVASILDSRLGASRTGEIEASIRWIEETVRIHERYAAQYSIEEAGAALLAEYDAALKGFADSVESEGSRISRARVLAL